jgi:serine/threonine-protein kinase RsbW
MQDATTLRVKAVLENVPLAIACAARTAEAGGCDAQALYQIQVAVDEVCANVVQHAYKGMEPGDMEVSCYYEHQTFVIRVRDWGSPFDPGAVPTPNLEAPLDERSLGGLGLFLVRQFMDGVEFTFDVERGNEVVMTKRLQVAE